MSFSCLKVGENKISMNSNVTTHQKVLNVFSNKQLSRQQIVDLIVHAYPDTNPKSVIPSDYCYNRINVDPSSFKLQVFEITSDDKYKWLGPNYPYSGPIYWKSEQVGKWEQGKCEIWKDPRKAWQGKFKKHEQ